MGGSVACECASRVAARHGTDGQWGSIQTLTDDNKMITCSSHDFMASESSLEDADHKGSLSADSSDYSSDQRRKLFYWLIYIGTMI
jgi:hypothetical protein